MTDRSVTVTVVKSTIGAWLAGFCSAATPVAISVVNHRYGGGSTWIDAFAVILAFVTILSLSVLMLGFSFRGTKDDAIKYLEKM